MKGQIKCLVCGGAVCVCVVLCVCCSDVTCGCEGQLGLQLREVCAHPLAFGGEETLGAGRQALHTAPSGQGEGAQRVALAAHKHKTLSNRKKKRKLKYGCNDLSTDRTCIK